jgi:hypothetical protein
MQKYKILLVSSAGGVLLDLLALKPWWRDHDAVWAVVKAADTQSALSGKQIVWVKERPFSRPWQLFKGILDALKILRQEKPDVIVSSGSGVAGGFFISAKILGIPSFWIETFNMIGAAGVTSWICTKIASEVIVQRSSLLNKYPKAVMIGELY